MKTTFALAAAVAVLVLPQAALAAEASPLRRLALASELLELSGADRNYDAITRGLLDPVLEHMMADMPADQRPVLTEVFRAAMSAIKDKSLRESAAAYAETFSEQELEAIIAFNRTPAGQALVEKTPQLAVRLGAVSAALMPDIMNELRTALCSRIECSDELLEALGAGAPPTP